MSKRRSTRVDRIPEVRFEFGWLDLRGSTFLCEKLEENRVGEERNRRNEPKKGFVPCLSPGPSEQDK
jgi:hypothetical protein